MRPNDLKIKSVWRIRNAIELGFVSHKRVIHNELNGLKGKILDVGCGIGNFSTYFPRAKYYGVDNDFDCIRYAGRHFAGNFFCADATELPFENAQFEAVLCVGLFHHLNPKQAETVVGQLARVLKPGGVGLIIEDEKPSVLKHPLSNILYRLDRGGKFRDPGFYQSLFSRYFTIKKTYPLRSGLWRYNIFVLNKCK